ncbi:hypothetical protein SPRA44_140027 [Serratia proteamaculans]|nr:hypothetical protein SPRA44_140027 [Serratia proteamaculans]
MAILRQATLPQNVTAWALREKDAVKISEVAVSIAGQAVWWDFQESSDDFYLLYADCRWGVQHQALSARSSK